MERVHVTAFAQMNNPRAAHNDSELHNCIPLAFTTAFPLHLQLHSPCIYNCISLAFTWKHSPVTRHGFVLRDRDAAYKREVTRHLPCSRHRREEEDKKAGTGVHCQSAAAHHEMSAAGGSTCASFAALGLYMYTAGRNLVVPGDEMK